MVSALQPAPLFAVHAPTRFAPRPKKSLVATRAVAAIASLVTVGCVGAIDAGGDAGRGPDASARADANGGDAASVVDGGGTSADGAEERETMYVEGRYLYDRCGEKVVLVGVNHPTIYVDRSGAAMSEIARSGANVVRIFWFATHGIAITEAEAAITAAAENGLIPMLEMHDATGPSNWGNMDAIVAYWTSDEAVAMIQRHEAHMLINIANEAGPNRGQDYDGFEAVYRDAIAAIRGAGIRVPLVIDASGWGRDYQVLLDRGPALAEADPLHSLIFSPHLYDPMTRAEIGAMLQQTVELGLPFIVGEFANRSPANGCGPALDYLGIIAEANDHDIGWLPWSWGDNSADGWWNGDCWEFDMTRTFSYDSLERWGLEVAVTDPNSIENTAIRPRSLTEGTCN